MSFYGRFPRRRPFGASFGGPFAGPVGPVGPAGPAPPVFHSSTNFIESYMGGYARSSNVFPDFGPPRGRRIIQGRRLTNDQGSRGRGFCPRGGVRGRGRYGMRGRGRGRVGNTLNKQQRRQQAVEERRKKTGHFFFYNKKLRCCRKVITNQCPHFLQPQPMDFLSAFDDPSYEDHSLNSSLMKTMNETHQIKRRKLENRFTKSSGLAVDQTRSIDEHEKAPQEEKTTNQINSPSDDSTNTPTLQDKIGSTDDAPSWVWPPPYKPKPLTKRQRKQIKDAPLGLGCMFQIPEIKWQKLNHSWVQVHKMKPWITIPCIKRLVARRDEMKEECHDLEKHIKWHPEDEEASTRRRKLERIYKRLRNRVHGLLKRVELHYSSAGFEGVFDVISDCLEERQDSDGIEVIFKKEHEDAAAEAAATSKASEERTGATKTVGAATSEAYKLSFVPAEKNVGDKKRSADVNSYECHSKRAKFDAI